MIRRSIIFFSILTLLIATAVVAQSSERWVVLRSEHLLLAMRADMPVEFYTDGDTLDAALSKFESRLRELEANFLEVEEMLQADYVTERLGRVPVLVYPSLEDYQLAANCLICAAHVGSPIAQPVNDDEALLSFGAHLNLESGLSTIFHEFVHIIDFAAVYAGAHAMWYEGMASYIGNKLLGESGQPIIDVLAQYLKLYQQEDQLGLRDYLTRPGYGRWTYNLGTNLINVLVERGGWDRYMQFYRALRRPDLNDYDELFREYYNLSLNEVEAMWQAQLDQTQVTLMGQTAFQFKMDQVVVRWIYLRPILKDPERLSQAYANLWNDDGFNVVESQFMRDYLNDFDNMKPSESAVPAMLQSAQQLRGYAQTYFQDAVRQGELERALINLEQVCADSATSCAFEYFNVIHQFVSWK